MPQEQVENIARLYYPKIASSIFEAFADYISVRTEQSKFGVLDLKPRTCASMTHDFLKRRIKAQIGEDPDVTIGEFNGIFGIIIQGKVFIRFKKFNKDLTTSNVITNQTDDFNNQANFASFGDRPTLLTAGYLPDTSWTQIKNIYLVCRSGDEIIWHKDLTSEIKQASIFSFEEQKDEPSSNRVSVKKNIDTGKTGTEDK